MKKKKGLMVTDSHCFMIDGVGFPFEMYHCGLVLLGSIGESWRFNMMFMRSCSSLIYLHGNSPNLPEDCW